MTIDLNQLAVSLITNYTTLPLEIKSNPPPAIEYFKSLGWEMVASCVKAGEEQMVVGKRLKRADGGSRVVLSWL